MFSDIGKYLWLAEASLTLAATAALLFAWSWTRTFLRKRAQKTQSAWDDITVHAVGLPLVMLILVVGLQHIVAVVVGQFPDYPSIKDFTRGVNAVAVVVSVFWALLRFIAAIERHYRRHTIRIGDKSIESGTLYSVFGVLRAGIMVLALLTVMDSLGVEISGILTVGGIGGIIIGFAAKDTLANFFAGMVIFWERPFVIGDWIRCPSINVEGVVEKIGWRMTQVLTFEQRPLYVPNSLFADSIIENPQRMTNRRIYEYMGVRYEDINKLPAILSDIRAMLQRHDGVDNTQIQMVNFDKYGESTLDFFIYAFTRTTKWSEFHAAKEDVLLQVSKIIARHNAEFAFPTRTVHCNNPPPSNPSSNPSPPAACGG